MTELLSMNVVMDSAPKIALIQWHLPSFVNARFVDQTRSQVATVCGVKRGMKFR